LGRDGEHSDRLITDGCWALHTLIDLGFFTDHSLFLTSENERLVEFAFAFALWTFGRHYLYSEEPFELDLSLIIRAANSDNAQLISPSLCLVKNMIAADPAVIQRFVELGRFETLQQSRDEGNFNVRAEAFHFLEAIVKRGNDGQIMAVVNNCACIEVFVEIIALEYPELTRDGLAALARVLRIADPAARWVCFSRFLEAEGLAVIREFAELGASEEVVRLDTKMLELVHDSRVASL
jgi:hypothetical protein